MQGQIHKEGIRNERYNTTGINEQARPVQEILKLRAEGNPVTIIQDLVKGNEEVAELRLKRDVAEASYFTGIEAMNNLRLEIEIIRSKLTWLRVEFKNS